MKMKVICTVLVLSFVFAGCSTTTSSPEKPGVSQTATAQTSQTPSAVPTQAATETAKASPMAQNSQISFVDNRSKNIVLDKPAESFILFPREAQALIALTGSTDEFKGMQPEDQKANAGRVIAKYYPELLKVNTNIAANNGSTPNIEELLKIKPDIVYEWSSRKEQLQALDAAGIKVVSVGWGEWKDDLERMKLYAAPLGQTERINSLLERQDKYMAEVQNITKKIPANEKMDHVFVDAIKGNELVVWGKELPFTPIHGVDNATFVKANLTNPSETINVETLLTWNPDMIVLNSYRNKATPEDIYNNPLFSNLSAVKNKKVYKSLDTSLVDNPISSWYWYATLAYPELFKDNDIRQRLVEDYKYLYNVDLTQEDIDNILKVSENKNSAGYEKFLSK